MSENKSTESDIQNEPSKSSRSTISKHTLVDVWDLTSLPDIFEETSKSEVIPEPIRSTEEICNEEECFIFKAIRDPELHQAYCGKAVQPMTESGEETYLRLVKQAHIAPVKRIINSLSRSSLNLQYYGLDSRQMKHLTEALLSNRTVQEVNLKFNILNLDAMFHLGQMLRTNKSIRKLNLQHCKISPKGAELLGRGLEICEFLNELDLSYNEIGDDGMEILAVKLGYNTSVKTLNLSHNNLTGRSGLYLADTMEENMTLQHLDLSWNQIADEQGLKKFLNTAMDQNESILRLNLSWNTLGGDKIANVIKSFIGQHKTIQELDLSHNRFETASENIKIAKGINSSTSLQVLNLSYNGITADSAFALLSNINNNATLRTLQLDNVWVKPEFQKLRQELQSQIGLRVVIQGVYGGVDIKGPDMQILLLKRAHYLGYKPKKMKKDFGWFLLRLQKAGTLAPVKKAKFEKLVEEDQIKFDEGMIEEFAKRFRDENKKIDLNLMLDKYLALYPETTLPVPKEKKKRAPSKDSRKSIKSQRLSKDNKDSMKGSPRASQKRSSSRKASRLSEEKSISKSSKDATRSTSESVLAGGKEGFKSGSVAEETLSSSKVSESLQKTENFA